jgi:hypothetical protein
MGEFCDGGWEDDGGEGGVGIRREKGVRERVEEGI